MLGKLMRRRRADSDEFEDPGRDKAIIHETVPEAVLYPERREAPVVDRSWMDTVKLVDPAEPAAKAPDAPVREAPPEPEAVHVPEVPPAADPGREPNAAAEARPRFPHGWLVVVEGPRVGDWFVLERGLASIGSAEGQTVRLEGDGAVAPERHAALDYDDGRHAFRLHGAEGVRLNGIAKTSRAWLRDGDVITVGGTSLRLVALCSPNFHWNAETTGG